MSVKLTVPKYLRVKFPRVIEKERFKMTVKHKELRMHLIQIQDLLSLEDSLNKDIELVPCHMSAGLALKGFAGESNRRARAVGLCRSRYLYLWRINIMTRSVTTIRPLLHKHL